MQEYEFSPTRIFPYKDKIVDFVLIRENTGQKNPYFCIFYAMFEAMIGPINPNPYVHRLNEKILPQVIQNPVKHLRWSF